MTGATSATGNVKAVDHHLLAGRPSNSVPSPASRSGARRGPARPEGRHLRGCPSPRRRSGTGRGAHREGRHLVEEEVQAGRCRRPRPRPASRCRASGVPAASRRRTASSTDRPAGSEIAVADGRHVRGGDGADDGGHGVSPLCICRVRGQLLPLNASLVMPVCCAPMSRNVQPGRCRRTWRGRTQPPAAISFEHVAVADGLASARRGHIVQQPSSSARKASRLALSLNEKHIAFRALALSQCPSRRGQTKRWCCRNGFLMPVSSTRFR